MRHSVARPLVRTEKGQGCQLCKFIRPTKSSLELSAKDSFPISMAKVEMNHSFNREPAFLTPRPFLF